MTQSRDYMGELNDYIYKAFDNVKYFSMQSRKQFDPYVYGQSPITYALHLEIGIPLMQTIGKDIVAMSYHAKNDWLQEFSIGSQYPESVNVSHQIDQAGYKLVATYYIRDLDGFLDELKRVAMERFNNTMNELIDSVLSSEEEKN